jgi:hypothetical protein
LREIVEAIVDAIRVTAAAWYGCHGYVALAAVSIVMKRPAARPGTGAAH